MHQQVKIPFLNDRSPIQYKSGYWSMLVQRFVPHMKILSITTAMLVLIAVVFMVPQILYKPGNYAQFMQLPTQMNKWALDIQRIHSNKFYIYQVVTAMFLHENYLHFIGNIIFAVFIMYELEYCWRPSLLIGLFAGVTAHFVGVIFLEGLYVGFSGALAGYFALYLVALVVNCRELSTRYQHSQLFFMFALAILMSLMIIGMGKGALMHLFGYLSGFIYGAAFYPSGPGSLLSSLAELILKIFSVFIFGGLAIWAYIS